jgi:hypothetical protein
MLGGSRRIGWIPAVFLAFCSLAFAAEHHGLVKFGGLPVPGATVTATQADKRFTAVTDQQGAYSFPDLPDGVWNIRVEMLCFAPMEKEVAVTAQAPAPEWELKLLPLDQMGAVAPPPSPTPAVTAAQAIAAPAQPAPAASKKAKPSKTGPQPGNTPSGFQRADLNASADAAKLAPDSIPAGPNETSPAPSDGFLINGSVNNGASTPFAQSAAFGNNRFRRSLYNGSLGLNFADSALNARPFSLTGQDTPQAPYTQTTGLLALAGPLNIPHAMPRGPNMTLNYQWTRNRNDSTSTNRVPTAAERGGDFSQSLNALGGPVVATDPATGAPFPNDAVPSNRFSPQARVLLGLYPAANLAGQARYNYQIPLVGSIHTDSLQLRGNKTIKMKNSISGQFAMQSVRSDSTSVLGFLDDTRSLGYTASMSWSRRVTTRSFATLGVQYSRQASRVTPYFANRWNISGMAGIAGNNQDPVNWGPPALNFGSGIAPLSDAENSFTRNQTAGVTGSLYWSHGSHNLTSGADFRRQQFNLLSQQDPRGTFTFTGAAAGSDFAGFLLGIPDASSIAFGNADKYLRAGSYDGYFTDDWRWRSNLTVNAGMRWEYSSPVTERYGRLVNLDVAPGFAAIAPVIADNPVGPLTGLRYPDSLVHPDRHAFQPRIGISWRPLPASSVVVRAGYGIYYDTSIYMSIALRMMQQSPLSTSLSVQNTAANPLTLANGFSAPPNVTTNTFAVDPNFRVGYAQNWQVSIQRDLPGSLVGSATYLGVKGTRSQQQFLPNTYPTGAPDPCPLCPSGYYYLTSNGNSTRQSGQFQLRRRLHSGVTAQVSYTYSKAIDDAALGGQGSVIAQNWLNLGAERGLSSFDQRHLVSASAQYTSGMGLRGGTLMSGWRGGLFKDWTVLTQLTAGSGLPLTPIYQSVVRGTGVTGSIRPDYTGAALYAAPAGLFLNPAAIAAPGVGQWGNAGRDSITGPGQFSLGASLARTFRISERVSADFRVDSTNTLNHVTYGSYMTTLNSQFGLPSGANGMRKLQTTLRVRF